MHGSIREREKIMRGLTSMETPFIKGNKIYFKLRSLSSALGGRTPAEAAGVGISGEK